MEKSNYDVKTHFKMYKKGKLWLVAAATTASLLAGGQLVKADTVTTSDSQPVANTTNAQNVRQTANNNQVTLSGNSTTQPQKTQSGANTSTRVATYPQNQSSTESTSLTSAATVNNTPQVNPQAKEVKANNHWYLKDQKGNNLTGFQKLNNLRLVQDEKPSS